jgi:plasmid stability protein
MEHVPEVNPGCVGRRQDGVDMCGTCTHVARMSVMIQIRNVPEALHREMKSRAAQAGMSLSDYLLRELQQLAERPTMAQMRERLRQRTPVETDIDPVDVIRAMRDAV